MCGIAGVIHSNPQEINLNRLRRMTDVIQHRGPDGEGQWIGDNGNVGFGHRRLSILDLSDAGAQPMSFGNGRYCITFNGEIYNYLEIKNSLIHKGYVFSSGTDTEVLLALYDLKREQCLHDLDGMFAFAIYDAKTETVFCACDRFGEKPFFYSYKPGQYFIFGSEMKVLWAAGIPKEINNNMLFNYISFNMLENADNKKETFYENIYRLENAHYLTVSVDDLKLEKRQYWDINFTYVDASITLPQATAKFQELFYNSVKRRLRSDVPVGSSLSGGLDSSLIVCVANELLKENNSKSKTFSARFPGFVKDEGYYMQKVIDHTNVEPHFTYPDDTNLLNKIEEIYYHQEEPFGSASICVQYEVMKLAKDNGVIVLLDGQGADEILAGYHHYYDTFFRELKKEDKQKHGIALTEYQNLHQENNISSKNNGRGISPVMQNKFSSIIDPLRNIKHQVKQIVRPAFSHDFYAGYASKSYLKSNFPSYAETSLNGALYYNTFVRGLTELLRYADRNSMAHSREVRLPFLSHELVEFLFTLPADFKIRNAWTKYIMRLSFEDILPAEITWRKDKIGYEPPQKAWMENKQVKEAIQGSKEMLVNKGILHKRLLDVSPKGVEANTKGDNSWQYWMAANLFL